MKIVLGLKIPESDMKTVLLYARQSGKSLHSAVISEMYKKHYGTIKRTYRRIA